MSSLPVVWLGRGRDASLRRRHPWVFSGAVARVEGSPEPGGTVLVRAEDGTFLAYGAYSSQSQIRVRVWGFDEQKTIDAAFIRRRIERAAARRQPLLDSATSAARIVHGESDGLPGLIVDRYAEILVIQVLTVGAEAWRQTILETLRSLPGVRSVYERSDAEARSKEGLEKRIGLAAGDEPPVLIEIDEEGRRLGIDVRAGHKTGFYLDQRFNRSALSALLRSGATPADPDLLDVFCYSGGFSVAAASAGVGRVTQIDSSAPALAAAREHLERVEWGGELEQIEGNAFGELRRLRAEERRFDVIVLDPPKFADSKARVERAARGYKDINLLAFQLLRPGGHLLSFSCSGRVSSELFGKIVASAASDAGVSAQIIGHFEAGPDHPVSLAFPEGAYLKGLLCRVV